jgi:hypothetical protein
MSTIGSVYNWQSHMTHLTSPRHSYTDSSHQDSLSQHLSQLLWCTSNMPSTIDLSSLLYCKASHRPMVLSPSMPPQTCDKTSPKLSQKEGFPNSSHKITSRKHKSSHVERLGSLRELTPLCLSLPQNAELILLSLFFKYSFLGCVPLFSYRDSKGHHREPSHPLGVLCPFVNPCVHSFQLESGHTTYNSGSNNFL